MATQKGNKTIIKVLVYYSGEDAFSKNVTNYIDDFEKRAGIGEDVIFQYSMLTISSSIIYKPEEFDLLLIKQDSEFFVNMVGYYTLIRAFIRSSFKRNPVYASYIRKGDNKRCFYRCCPGVDENVLELTATSSIGSFISELVQLTKENSDTVDISHEMQEMGKYYYGVDAVDDDYSDKDVVSVISVDIETMEKTVISHNALEDAKYVTNIHAQASNSEKAYKEEIERISDYYKKQDLVIEEMAKRIKIDTNSKINKLYYIPW